MVSINKKRWAFTIIGLVIVTNASANDVAGTLLGPFFLSGCLIGLIVGVASPRLSPVKFLRGGAIAVSLSLIPWASLLLYWDFPFPNKTLIGNLPVLLFVLIGTVPIYLIVYGLVWMVVAKKHPHGQEQSLSNPHNRERHVRKSGTNKA